jgi:hypothetical protein
MKSSLSLLFTASTAYASPYLSERHSTCASTPSISAARAAEVRNAFLESGIIPDVVPDITPTTELSVKYGNINENLGNKFDVLRKPSITHIPIFPSSHPLISPNH